MAEQSVKMSQIKYLLLWLIYRVVNVILFFAKKLKKYKFLNKFCENLIASGDLGKASRAYEKKDYNKVLQIVEPYKDYDDDYSFGYLIYFLGLLYYHGYSVNKDLMLADKYFMRSAGLGNEDAIQYLSDKSKFENRH